MSSSEYETLLKRIEDYHLDDVNVKYYSSFDEAIEPELVMRTATLGTGASFRLPCRLASPMIKLPPEVVDYCRSGFPVEFKGLNQITLNSLYTLGHTIRDLLPERSIEGISFYSDIDSLLIETTELSNLYAKMPGYHNRQIDNITDRMTKWLVDVDLKGMMMKSQLDYELQTADVKIPPLVSMINRVRAVSTRMYGKHNGAKMVENSEDYGMELTLTEKAHIILTISDGKEVISIIFSDRFAMIYNKSKKIVIITGMAYMDYVFTREEIKHNLEIISASGEYDHLSKLFTFLRVSVESSDKHEKIVEFMKSYEGFLNMTADFKADKRSSIGSYKDVLSSLIAIDYEITSIRPTMEEVINLLFGTAESKRDVPVLRRDYSMLLRLAHAISELSPIHLLEASSLHKLCFYAVVDEKKGFSKFCKRTHTKRECDPEYIELMRAYFNKTYILGYYDKHKRLPPVLSDPDLVRKADICKNLRKTDPTDIQQKIAELNEQIKKENRLETGAKPLMWWYNLRPYSSETTAMTESPIEQSKDKRSATIKGTYSVADSEKELESIIKAEEFNYIPIVGNERLVTKEKMGRIIQQDSMSYDDQFTAVLKEKEREQKSEGRLFGMFTTAGKQSVSLLMRKTEHVLSYFEGNLMTPPDKQRKMKLHWMAQSLLDDDTYSILADIEAHNQAMQHDNTGDLSESIGLCYGEFAWNQLAKLFGSLNLFYATFYSDLAFLSNGQEGGIEGWYNPMWTLHTLIVTKLVNDLTDIDQKSVAVYSDDIAMIVRINVHTDDTLNTVLKTIQTHYLKFGMVLKALQTVVSKTRVTMLRQHYSSGIRADSALKRMVAVSCIGNSAFHSDELEASGVSSAISSSVELSNSIYTQCALKWRRIVELLLRPFISIMSTMIDERYLEDGILSDRTRSLYRSMYDYGGGPTSNWVTKSLEELTSTMSKSEASEYLTRIKNRQGKQRLSTSQLSTFRDSLIHCLLEDDALYVFFFIRAICPQDLGGCNVLLHEMIILTGVRDSVGRTYGAMSAYLQFDKRYSAIFAIALEFALGGNGRSTKKDMDVINNPDKYIPVLTSSGERYFSVEYDPEVLITQEWPNAQRSSTTTELVRKSLKEYFVKICRNKELMRLLEFDELRMKYKRALISELGDRYYQKIASFYLDVSVFMIIDKLLGKVENTSSLIRKTRLYKNICFDASNIGILSFRKWLRSPAYTFGRINEGDNIQMYLFKRRQVMFPDINFLEVIEPEANQLLYSDRELDTEPIDPNWYFHLVHSPGMIYKDGVMRFLPPVYGSEAQYKGALKDPDSAFSHIREALLVKAVSVTKWILYRSDPKKYFEMKDESTNIKNCANLALATLGYGSFDEYESYVPLVTRSEIAHRIPILDVKPKAAIRSLPSLSTRFRAIYNQKLIHSMNLEDSNIHFDYMKLRLVLASTASISCKQIPILNQTFGIRMNYLIRDVQFDYLMLRNKLDVGPFKNADLPVKYYLEKVRIHWLSSNLESILVNNGTAINPSNGISTSSVNSYQELTNVLICDYFSSIKKQNLWDTNPFWTMEPWEPFRKMYRDTLPEDDSEFRDKIISVISDNISKRSNSVSNEYALRSNEAAYRAIIGAYKEQNSLQDEKYLEAKNTVESSLLMMQRLKANEPISKSEMNAAMDGIKLSRFVFLHNIIADIMLKYCIVTSSYSGKCMIDEIQSRLLFENLSEIIASSIKILDQHKMLLYVIHHQLGLADLVEHFNVLIDELKDIAENMPLEIEIEESLVTKTKFADSNLGSLVVKNHGLGIPTYVYDITSINGDEAIKLSKSIQIRSKYISRFGSPAVMEGPYASDVYQTAMSMVKALKDFGILSNKSGILDFVSGRGEFAAAIDKCGIKRRSYSREDIYSLIRHHTDINYLHDYDWCSESIPDVVSVEVEIFRDEYPLSLVDISHLGQNKRKFTDRFLDLCLISRYSMTRLSNIDANFDRFLSTLSKSDKSIYVMMAGSEIFQCPVAYILVCSNLDRVPFLKGVPSYVECIDHIIHDVKKLIRVRSSDQMDNGPLSCSVIQDMGGGDTVELKLASLIEIVADSKDNKHLMNLITKKQRVKVMPIMRMHYEELSNTIVEEDSPLRMYNGSLDDFYAHFRMAISEAEKAKLTNRKPNDVVYYVDLDNARESELIYLRRFHPVRVWRVICNSILLLGLSKENRQRLTLLESINNLWAGRGQSTDLSTARSRNVMESFGLLVSDVLMDSPNYYAELISMAHRSQTINSRKASDLYYYRKMMSGLYPYVKQFFKSWYNMNMYGDKIRSVIIDRYVRPSLYTKKKLITMDFSKIMDSTGNRGGRAEDEKLREMFLEAIDSMLDFEVFANGLVQSNLLSAAKDDRETTIQNIDRIEVAFNGIALNPGDLKWNIGDDVIEREKKKIEELSTTIAKQESEDEERYLERLRITALMAEMYEDDYFEEDF